MYKNIIFTILTIGIILQFGCLFDSIDPLVGHWHLSPTPEFMEQCTKIENRDIISGGNNTNFAYLHLNHYESGYTELTSNYWMNRPLYKEENSNVLKVKRKTGRGVPKDWQGTYRIDGDSIFLSDLNGKLNLIGKRCNSEYYSDIHLYDNFFGTGLTLPVGKPTSTDYTNDFINSSGQVFVVPVSGKGNTQERDRDRVFLHNLIDDYSNNSVTLDITEDKNEGDFQRWITNKEKELKEQGSINIYADKMTKMSTVLSILKKIKAANCENVYLVVRNGKERHFLYRYRLYHKLDVKLEIPNAEMVILNDWITDNNIKFNDRFPY